MDGLVTITVSRLWALVEKWELASEGMNTGSDGPEAYSECARELREALLKVG